MEEPAQNHPAKQNGQTHVQSNIVNKFPPLMQGISQDDAVSQLWSYIQLSLCKLSTQRDAIISVFATQLTLCIKAPRPSPHRRGGGADVKLQGSTPTRHSNPCLQTDPTHQHMLHRTEERDEAGEERLWEWAKYPLWQTHRGDGGQGSDGWMGEEKLYRKTTTYQFWALLCRCHPCVAR